MSNVNFEIYISKLLKILHPQFSISTDANSQLNYFFKLLAEEIVKKAVFILNGDIYMMKKSPKSKKTLSSKEIQTSVQIIFGKTELTKHAVSEGAKAILKFTSITSNKQSQRITSAKKSGLIFPPSKLKIIIKKYHNGNIASGAPVYLAAVLEYICAEFLELSGNQTRDYIKKVVTPMHIRKAIENDEELFKLINKIDWKMLGGGVDQNINFKLLQKQKSKKV